MIRSNNKVLAVLFLVGGLIWLLAAIYNFLVRDEIHFGSYLLYGYGWLLVDFAKASLGKEVQFLLLVLAVVVLLGTMLNWALKLSLSPMTVIIFCLLMDEDAQKKKGE